MAGVRVTAARLDKAQVAPSGAVNLDSSFWKLLDLDPDHLEREIEEETVKAVRRSKGKFTTSSEKAHSGARTMSNRSTKKMADANASSKREKSSRKTQSLADEIPESVHKGNRDPTKWPKWPLKKTESKKGSSKSSIPRKAETSSASRRSGNKKTNLPPDDKKVESPRKRRSPKQLRVEEEQSLSCVEANNNTTTKPTTDSKPESCPDSKEVEVKNNQGSKADLTSPQVKVKWLKTFPTRAQSVKLVGLSSGDKEPVIVELASQGEGYESEEVVVACGEYRDCQLVVNDKKLSLEPLEIKHYTFQVDLYIEEEEQAVPPHSQRAPPTVTSPLGHPATLPAADCDKPGTGLKELLHYKPSSLTGQQAGFIARDMDDVVEDDNVSEASSSVRRLNMYQNLVRQQMAHGDVNFGEEQDIVSVKSDEDICRDGKRYRVSSTTHEAHLGSMKGTNESEFRPISNGKDWNGDGRSNISHHENGVNSRSYYGSEQELGQYFREHRDLQRRSDSERNPMYNNENISQSNTLPRRHKPDHYERSRSMENVSGPRRIANNDDRKQLGGDKYGSFPSSPNPSRRNQTPVSPSRNGDVEHYDRPPHTSTPNHEHHNAQRQPQMRQPLVTSRVTPINPGSRPPPPKHYHTPAVPNSLDEAHIHRLSDLEETVMTLHKTLGDREEQLKEVNEARREMQAHLQKIKDSSIPEAKTEQEKRIKELIADKENLATEIWKLKKSHEDGTSAVDVISKSSKSDDSKPLTNGEHGEIYLESYDPNNPNAQKRRIADLQCQLADLAEVNETTVATVIRLEKEIQQLREENKALKSSRGYTVEDLEQENVVLRKQIEKLRSELRSDDTDYMRQELHQLRGDLRILRDKNHQLVQDNIKLTEHLKDIESRPVVVREPTQHRAGQSLDKSHDGSMHSYGNNEVGLVNGSPMIGRRVVHPREGREAVNGYHSQNPGYRSNGYSSPLRDLSPVRQARSDDVRGEIGPGDGYRDKHRHGNGTVSPERIPPSVFEGQHNDGGIPVERSRNRERCNYNQELRGMEETDRRRPVRDNHYEREVPESTVRERRLSDVSDSTAVLMSMPATGMDNDLNDLHIDTEASSKDLYSNSDIKGTSPSTGYAGRPPASILKYTLTKQTDTTYPSTESSQKLATYDIRRKAIKPQAKDLKLGCKLDSKFSKSSIIAEKLREQTNRNRVIFSTQAEKTSNSAMVNYTPARLQSPVTKYEHYHSVRELSRPRERSDTRDSSYSTDTLLMDAQQKQEDVVTGKTRPKPYTSSITYQSGDWEL